MYSFVCRGNSAPSCPGAKAPLTQLICLTQNAYDSRENRTLLDNITPVHGVTACLRTDTSLSVTSVYALQRMVYVTGDVSAMLQKPHKAMAMIR